MQVTLGSFPKLSPEDERTLNTQSGEKRKGESASCRDREETSIFIALKKLSLSEYLSFRGYNKRATRIIIAVIVY